ncbi:MAG: rhomboid family intramembrane serine protease GlpG [Alteromonadaceae bacterium]|nr:rhomboid family intramembrane serine protease GlpG [Alteromonadaceae bacterium]
MIEEHHALVAFKDASPAKNLVTYLNSISISAHMREVKDVTVDSQYVVVIEDQAQLPRAELELQGFLDKPWDKQYTSAAWDGGAIPDASSGNSLSISKLSNSLFALFKQTPIVAIVLALCAIPCIAVYAFGLGNTYNYLSFQSFEYINQTQQWWRLFTPALMHFSAMHIVFNLLWWWWLGKQVESQQSGSTLLLLLLFSAALSNTAQYLVSDIYFGGLSGVVYALVAYVWIHKQFDKQSTWQFSNAMMGFMLLWMILGFADVLWVNMANTAHLVGLVAGGAFAAGALALRQDQRQ